MDEAWVMMRNARAERNAQVLRAGSRTLSSADQLALTADDSDTIRESLALNPSITLEVQMVLVHDPSGDVLDALAHNISLHPQAQEALFRTGDAYALAVLAENPALDPDLMTALTVHAEDSVREALARNPRISSALAQLLVMDASPAVCRAAAHNTSLRLHTDLPVPALQVSERGRAYLGRHLRGFDAAASDALTPSWCGTLRELKGALEAFA